MSSFFETSPAREFFNDLERWFIDLRGAPQKLSNDDYQVAKAWYETGIPLDLVQAEIETVVAKDKAEDNELKSRLRYYCRPVERAFEQRRRLQAPGVVAEAATFDLPERLTRLAAALPDAPWSAELGERIVALGTPGQDAESVEATLADLEEDAFARAEAGFDAAQTAAFEAKLRESLEGLADRLPGGVSEAARKRLKRQILRRFLDMPEMSLFGVDAAPLDGTAG